MQQDKKSPKYFFLKLDDYHPIIPTKPKKVEKNQLMKLTKFSRVRLFFSYYPILPENRLLGDFSMQFHPNMYEFIQSSSGDGTILELGFLRILEIKYLFYCQLDDVRTLRWEKVFKYPEAIHQ